MIIYTGQGYLVIILFTVPLVAIGAILYWGFGIDMLRTPSWWPLHSIMILEAILTLTIGWYLNRKKLQEVTYEKSGPVTVWRAPHTFYGLRMEYWGPIVLLIYFGLIAYRYFR